MKMSLTLFTSDQYFVNFSAAAIGPSADRADPPFCRLIGHKSNDWPDSVGLTLRHVGRQM
jgi:hypothetical protein